MSQSGPPERASLASALEEEEARLRRLEAERAGAKARADALRAQLAALDEAPVLRIEQRDDHGIVALCKRGTERQAIEITELPAPREKPAGAEWIEAYRHWRGGR